MYVLDTNTLIYLFKGQGQVAQNLARVPPQEIGIPTIVLFELQVGIAKSNFPAKRIQQLEELACLPFCPLYRRPGGTFLSTLLRYIQ